MHCFLKWIKFSVKQTNTKKILENWKKYWKSQGKVREFCQSGKVGTLIICTSSQKGGMHGRRVCVAGGMHGVGHVWQEGSAWPEGGRLVWQDRRPLQRTVRILLECILVE